MPDHDYPPAIRWNWGNYIKERQLTQDLEHRVTPDLEGRIDRAERALKSLKEQLAQTGRDHTAAAANARLSRELVEDWCAKNNLPLPPEPAEPAPEPVTCRHCTRPIRLVDLPGGGQEWTHVIAGALQRPCQWHLSHPVAEPAPPAAEPPPGVLVASSPLDTQAWQPVSELPGDDGPPPGDPLSDCKSPAEVLAEGVKAAVQARQIPRDPLEPLPPNVVDIRLEQTVPDAPAEDTGAKEGAGATVARRSRGEIRAQLIADAAGYRRGGFAPDAAAAAQQLREHEEQWAREDAKQRLAEDTQDEEGES